MRRGLLPGLAICGLAVWVGVRALLSPAGAVELARPAAVVSPPERDEPHSMDAGPAAPTRRAVEEARQPSSTARVGADRDSFVAQRARELAAVLAAPDATATLRSTWEPAARALAADLESGDARSLAELSADERLTVDLRLAALDLRRRLAAHGNLEPAALVLLRNTERDRDAFPARAAVAARLLAAAGSARDVRHLVEELTTLEASGRRLTAWALQAGSVEQVAPALASRIAWAAEPEAVEFASIALEQVLAVPVRESLRDELARPLLDRLADAELGPRVRGRIALAASRLETAATRRALVELLADGGAPPELRSTVAGALGRMHLGDDPAALGAVLDSPATGDEARLRAAGLLARLDDPRWSVHAAERLEGLARGLEDARLRGQAVRTLSTLGSARGQERRRRLLEDLRRHDLDWGVRHAAARALARLE